MIYKFDRYRDGVKMAQGATITRAENISEAEQKARDLFFDCPTDVFKRVPAGPEEGQ